MEKPKQNPDQLLHAIRNDMSGGYHGKLKIFFGYASGAGKTYTMLQAAHQAKKRGIDVVAGYIAPHADPQTTVLLHGLERLPVKLVRHNGITLHELDIDAALKRKPQLILVDEFAHTNADGSRHVKRYQDVQELLNAGIDVYTTVNVQHIESLSDTIASITGIMVRERIPDSVFDNADQVKLVDIEPAELLERLEEENIHQKDQTEFASVNFFTLENLNALREIALRRCANRVNLLTENARLQNLSACHTNEHNQKNKFSKPALTDRLIAAAPNSDIYAIPDTSVGNGYPGNLDKFLRVTVMPVRDVAKSILILLAATLVAYAFYTLGFSEANIVSVYVFCVLVISVITTNRFCGLIASIVSVLVFNFFFTIPRFTFHFNDPNYLVTFSIMFMIALLTGSLAARLKNSAKQSAHAAYRIKILFETNQLLQKEEDEQSIVSATAGQLLKLLKKDIIIYLSEGSELMTPNIFRTPDSERNNLISENEKKVAEWVLRNNTHAGATTDTLSNARCMYLAIRVNQQVYGVVGIAMNGIPLDSFENSVLLSILGECAVALENIKNAREKEEAAIQVKNEQLRANLLRAISHDLRTPLTSISGNADNLLTNYQKMDDDTRKRTFTDIYDDSMWLINLVENLLAVTRIEGGQVHLTQSVELMEEVITEALRHINRKSKEHTIRVSSSEELILAHIDAKLIVQVIINLVDNAIKYTPAGSLIEIHTEKAAQQVIVSVSDNGPGIPDRQKPYVFDMFYSGANKIADSRRSLGLGLSLCKSIVTAHGGIISVADNQPEGTIFTFTLPAGEVELHE